MADGTQGLFLSYVSGGGGVDAAYHFNVSFDGGRTQQALLMDTGSPWLNVGADYLPDGTYTVCEPQPPYAYPSYSSDGNTYQGQWVTVTATLTGGNGASFTVPSLVIFRATAPSNVAMMGVSTRMMGLDALNIFLSVPEIVAGTFPPGYILNQDGVQFGYDTATAQQFTQVPVIVDGDQRTALAQVTLTAPLDLTLSPYSATLPFLMDTGIDYTIITPALTPNRTAPLPDPTQWEEPNPSGGQQFIPGVTIAVGLGTQVRWGFNTSQCGTTPLYPAYARLAEPSPLGIINTGRHFLASYQYMIQLDARIGATAGAMGFLAV